MISRFVKKLREIFVPEPYRPSPQVEAEWDRILKQRAS